MQEPVVSVIVPVYKVESYLQKCLDSIVNQTYKNLQIILVDDGSPDNCGAICNEYAEKDDRITVIHQENGGLSAARNTGLDIATGEWVAFVDSDDWISADCILRMIDNAIESGADIVSCGRFEEQRGSVVYSGPKERAVLSRKQAIEELLIDNEIKNYAWDKLWRAKLFNDLRFPVGRTYEDISVCYQLFDLANYILCLPEAHYHYVIRSSGIGGDYSLNNRLNRFIAARDRYESIKEKYPQCQEELADSCVSAAIGIWCGYYRNSKEERDQVEDIIAEITALARQNKPSKKIRQSIGLAGRVVMNLIPYNSWWSFALAGFIGRLYQIRHGRAL